MDWNCWSLILSNVLFFGVSIALSRKQTKTGKWNEVWESLALCSSTVLTLQTGPIVISPLASKCIFHCHLSNISEHSWQLIFNHRSNMSPQRWRFMTCSDYFSFSHFWYDLQSLPKIFRLQECYTFHRRLTITNVSHISVFCFQNWTVYNGTFMPYDVPATFF